MSEFSVYVACSSAEIERAERWIRGLRDRKILVTSTWPETIRRVQAERNIASTAAASNPRQATREDRQKWAMENVLAIKRATHLWLLCPPSEHVSQGAYFEFGVAWNDKRTIASGGDQRFVFSALADDLYETDEQAFERVLELAQARLKDFVR